MLVNAALSAALMRQLNAGINAALFAYIIAASVIDYGIVSYIAAYVH